MTAPGETDDETPTQDSVVFYWRPGCGFCWSLRRRLNAAGVSLDERNIWEDADAAAVVRSAADGNETVPTVVVAGQALVNPTVREVLAHLGHSRPSQPPSRLRSMVHRLLGARPQQPD